MQYTFTDENLIYTFPKNIHFIPDIIIEIIIWQL